MRRMAAVLALMAASAGADVQWTTSYEEGLKLAKEKGLTLHVHFWAEW